MISDRTNEEKRAASQKRWEFYKDASGLWRWRAMTAPKKEQNHSLQVRYQDNQAQDRRNWDWGRQCWHWVEVDASMKGYQLRSDCETNAKQHGWL